MKLILASNNQKKLVEMREILSQLGFDVVSQWDAGLNIEVEETGETFAENAFLKADAVCKASGMPAIADDSGLVVDALDGAPGVYSARYGGEGLDDVDRYILLLENMKDISNRAAKFVSAIVCVFPNGDVLSAEGECLGEILHSPRGDGGFGYDPVFFVHEASRGMAEITAEEKNTISHRAKALREFCVNLEEYMTQTTE